uniref:Uncharacterized protein n=1 Tax=Pararge aegeria TaxID=116150 RepID=S4NLD6_9NEOP
MEFRKVTPASIQCAIRFLLFGEDGYITTKFNLLSDDFEWYSLFINCGRIHANCTSIQPIKKRYYFKIIALHCHSDNLITAMLHLSIFEANFLQIVCLLIFKADLSKDITHAFGYYFSQIPFDSLFDG